MVEDKVYTRHRPSTQVRVLYRKPGSYVMTPSRRRICRPLIRRNFHSFAATMMKSGTSRQATVKMVGRMLQKEVA